MRAWILCKRNETCVNTCPFPWTNADPLDKVAHRVSLDRTDSVGPLAGQMPRSIAVVCCCASDGASKRRRLMRVPTNSTTISGTKV